MDEWVGGWVDALCKGVRGSFGIGMRWMGRPCRCNHDENFKVFGPETFLLIRRQKQPLRLCNSSSQAALQLSPLSGRQTLSGTCCIRNLPPQCGTGELYHEWVCNVRGEIGGVVLSSQSPRLSPCVYKQDKSPILLSTQEAFPVPVSLKPISVSHQKPSKQLTIKLPTKTSTT